MFNRTNKTRDNVHYAACVNEIERHRFTINTYKLTHNVNIGSLIICDDKLFLSNELCIVYPRGDKEQATS